MNQVGCVFFEDNQLPADVVRKKYSERVTGFAVWNAVLEFSFDPTVVTDSIETPLWFSHALLANEMVTENV
jgi:hypothetical protein